MNFDNTFSHVLTYNKNLIYPLLTDGWTEMRDFFKFSDLHQFCLIFYGNNLFFLTESRKIHQPKQIPIFHSRCILPNHTANFFTKLTKKCVATSYFVSTFFNLYFKISFQYFIYSKIIFFFQNIFEEFEEYVRTNRLVHITLCTDNGTTQVFQVLCTTTPFSITAVGVNWNIFCQTNSFQEGDTICFKFTRLFRQHIGHVFKLLT
jgi:hypothetical protein